MHVTIATVAWIGLSIAPSFDSESVGHEHWQFCVAQDVAGGAAKNHLPQSALCITTLDQEVTAQCVRVSQNHLTRQAAVKTDGQRFCRHPVQLQITAQLFTCWSGY